jgi:dTDP-4-amino-4,6-dideoxygalactose transaminase
VTTAAARSVPFFNYEKAFTAHEEQYVAIFRDVMHRGAFIMQKDLTTFEGHLAEYVGVKHAIGVGNATDALTMAFRAAGLKPGDEVVFPSHTMVASPASVAVLGGVPVPVDCDDDHLMDPDAIEAAITPRTRFIMPVQLNGRTCRMDAIQAIATKHKLQIIEDSAQGLGSRYKGRYAGSFGLAGVFSFYPAKILGCFGDGGAVITNDDALARTVILLRDHGRNSDGDVELWGINSRLDNLQAAILDFQFQDYRAIIGRRRAIASLYQELLGDVSQLTLPPAPGADADHFDTYQNYEIEADRRDELKQHLRDRGIGTLIQWGGKAVHQFPKLGLRQRLPRTERLFERCLMLPMNLTVADADARYVAATIREFYGC